MDIKIRTVSELEDKLVCNFKLAVDVVGVISGSLSSYDTDRSAILKGDLVGLYVDGNW